MRASLYISLSHFCPYKKSASDEKVPTIKGGGGVAPFVFSRKTTL